MTENKQIMTPRAAKALGLKTYYTGKPCMEGHYAERRTSDGKCLGCGDKHRRQDQESNKRWRNKFTLEERREQVDNRDMRKFGVTTKEELRECRNNVHKQWRHKNIDKSREYQREYHRKWALANPDKVKTNSDKYRENKREELALMQAKADAHDQLKEELNGIKYLVHTIRKALLQR